MKLIDLFSGIGGFSLGFQRAGYQFTEHYFSEIDKHAIANYKHNFPNYDRKPKGERVIFKDLKK